MAGEEAGGITFVRRYPSYDDVVWAHASLIERFGGTGRVGFEMPVL